MRVINLGALAAAITVWFVVGRFLLGRRVAALAAGFMIFSPAISYKAHEIWDTFPTMLAGAVCLAVMILRPARRWWTSLLTGSVCGLGALINPCFSLCYPVWFVWGRRLRRAPTGANGRLIVDGLLVLLGFTAAIAPWSIRNRVVFGEWFYLRSNLGLELWIGTAPWSDGDFISVDGRRIHPVFDEGEAARLVERGEYQYFKDRMREARHWLRTDTLRVLRVSLRRATAFWLGRYRDDTHRLYQVVKFVGFTLPGALAVIGAIYAAFRRPRCGGLILTLIIFPLPYYLMVMMVRYRLPIEPLLLLMAALVLSDGISAILARHRPKRPLQPREAGSGAAPPH